MCRSCDATWGIGQTARVALSRVVLAFVLPLALMACSASQDRTQRLAARPADTLRAMNAGRSTGPSPTCRKLLRSAQRSFPMRQRALIQRYVVDLRDQGISHSPKDRTASLRRIAAGLSALREERVHAAAFPGSPTLYQPSVPLDFAEQVTAWTKAIRPRGVPGTSAGLDAPDGDYDFVMKELISLLYLFKDEPALLTDDAAWNILERGLLAQAQTEPQAHLTFDIQVPLLSDTLRYPETENHVLMTLSSIYLTRAFIAANPRHDPRVAALAKHDAKLADPHAYREPLLRATGRVLHDGFFETNARPYQALSTHALMNLYAFSPDAELQTGAHNALDYLATVFAFQSLEQKRFGPYRRSAKYADRIGMYDNDGVIFMMGVLAGGYAWPDDFQRIANATGHALWASLMPYRLPDAVQELMLHKHTGYWARMHSRFGSHDYQVGQPGRYLTTEESKTERGPLEALPELYFVTQRFLNAAGGRFNRLPVRGDTLKRVLGVQDLDFLARPHALIPRGHLDQWKNLDAMAEQTLIMQGSPRYWRSDNSGTYKSFSYGYQERPGSDVHLSFPMRYPKAWERFVYREGQRASFSVSAKSRASFRFLDLSNVEPYGFYVVMGRVSKSSSDVLYRDFSRGFWEVKEATLQTNPDAYFTNDVVGPRRYYRYRMTTGELLELDDQLGANTDRCENAIRRIWTPSRDGHGDTALSLAETTFDRCSAAAINRTPLLDVREVDGAFRFTGRKLAYAGGDGQLIVDNPYIGATLWLDSSEHDRPVRTVADLGPTF
jgi:hypothetical protein